MAEQIITGRENPNEVISFANGMKERAMQSALAIASSALGATGLTVADSLEKCFRAVSTNHLNGNCQEMYFDGQTWMCYPDNIDDVVGHPENFAIVPLTVEEE